MQNNPALGLLLTIGFIQMWMMPAIAWALLKDQRDVAARFWFAGTTCYAGTASLFVLGRFMSSDITAMLGFILVAGMLACFGESLRREFQNTPTPWLNWLLALLANLFMAEIIDNLWGSEVMRVTQLILISVMDLTLVALLLRVIRHKRSRGLKIVVVGVVVVAFTNILRVINFFSTDATVNLLSFSWSSNLGFIANFLSVVLYSFGYWGFVIEKNRAALAQEITARIYAQKEEVKALDREKSTAALLQEREQLISELAKMHRAVQVGALAASIAHEINQPLTSVRLSVEEAIDLQQQDDHNSRMTELLERINSETRRAFTTIRTISNFFKDKPVILEDREVDEIIRSVCALLNTRITRAGVLLQIDAQAPARVYVGTGELEHVILNLLSNSLDAFEKTKTHQPMIRILSRVDDGLVRITLKDNGPGIPESLHKNLFNIYKSSSPNNLGLGLWLSRYIAERYGGQLDLEDFGHEPGACFTLSLRHLD
jgi:C4-dicarboxylate-specific signal transduction histidine kinase